MKVILRKNFDQLGKVGEIVNVKDGYARNFLIPRGVAYQATQGNIRALEEEKKQIQKREVKELEEAQKLAAEMEKVSVTIPVKVGEEEKIFGTVTSQMIVDSLKEKGFDVDKRKVEITEPIKSLGIYSVVVKLHTNVTATVKTWVVRE
ncbi:MAG: 50S ribosomal protein L9 [Stygiobacter sp. RIFOXYC12_FULL_38_8]|nr:MAG: 50S ribosomal protein L9 [Stygiobacter sp.]KAF0215862.1 MAG: 50S ribosomal protein [Ignavibacteria bacterium]OGU63765.1 MAG: 50S ribosomal protein L9 [Stygiobacter sp. GWC2_38_9]OGU82723.1 MAG: 50S ribosomal protein L9 [Stygiobacter sp. RIFOXYA12_FULL_38_9]OGV08116.1 MAG: 50S ribosomal protein L9 [Stygiobacter sp. RIFOXYB2_FULL_37_11]OGV11884.1 MAG: 50S ribosomal protein L9 [Stygiobacter sp. RIFOXYA2_FULL_38_8]OGV15632.1 MAG: 50S ribosomal protein L9 [Stygiobacter sp. RIFOXYC2_FULL_38